MFYEIFVPLFTGLAVVAVGASLLAFRGGRRASVEARLRSLDAPTIPGRLPPEGANAPLAGVLGKVGQAVTQKPSKNLREDLAYAGFHSRSAPAIFMGAKMVLFLLGLPVLALASLSLQQSLAIQLVLVVGGAVALFFIPNIYVRWCREQRRTLIRGHLPDAIDLLEICVSAGMGLDQAWNSVANEVRNVCPILADEMALTNLEIHLGASRAMAMRHMADRTGSSDLGSLVAILVQSERFGTSVSDALRTFATSMRENRSNRAQEYVEKMAVKLIFPMVFFIFPAVVIVMAGPAFIALMKTLSGR